VKVDLGRTLDGGIEIENVRQVDGSRLILPFEDDHEEPDERAGSTRRRITAPIFRARRSSGRVPALSMSTGTRIAEKTGLGLEYAVALLGIVARLGPDELGRPQAHGGGLAQCLQRSGPRSGSTRSKKPLPLWFLPHGEASVPVESVMPFNPFFSLYTLLENAVTKPEVCVFRCKTPMLL
jgi:hypothetical protein